MGNPIKLKYPLFLRDINKGRNSVGGYPVVTVEDNFNIEAQPNTFYNIKNSADSEVIINCVDGYSVDGIGKRIMFTFDDWDSEEYVNIATFFSSLGGVILHNTTKEGYSYKMEIDTAIGIIPAYFTDDVKTGNSVTCLIDMTALGESEVTIPINNIQILNENVNNLVWTTMDSISYPHILIEVENDNEQYQHKYNVWGMLAISMGRETIYTNESYTTATNFYSSDGTDIASFVDNIEVKPNTPIPPSDIANEFIFNINSPANIIFNQEVKWNNNTAPDLTQTGICTISVVNGVGCYTFVNS